MYKQMIRDFLEVIKDTANSLSEFDEPIEMVEGYDVDIYDKDTLDYKTKHLQGTFVTSVGWIGDEVEYIRVPDNCTKDDAMKICKWIMSIVFDDPIHNYRQDFYKYELESYANRFARKLKSEWKCFQDVNLHALPIRITSDDAKTEDGEFDGQTQGNYNRYSGLISLYNVEYDRGSIEEDERTARHEVIHHMLFAARLNGYDDSPAFHFFCKVYDAGAYKPMTWEAQALYEALCIEYDRGKKDMVDDCFCEIIRKQNEDKTEDENKDNLPESDGNND